MPRPLEFADVGRLPSPEDNVAIAVRRLEAGVEIKIGNATTRLPHLVLEGHRFAVDPIKPGAPLLSWGLPFGHALQDIAPGDYVCNASMLSALAVRQRTDALPPAPNFADHLQPYDLAEDSISPAPPLAVRTSGRRFMGYPRAGGRGVGTRNRVVILGTTSRTGSFARQLARRLQPLAKVFPGVDGIVAVAHTEGGGTTEPNNANEVLRTLAGFLVHPNVGAVLAVDQGSEPVTNARLRAFMAAHGHPLAAVPHAFLSIQDGVAAAMAEGESIVKAWLPEVAATDRVATPLSELRIALQCGGSDAFSGVSGNPLAGALTHEIIREGGIGVLCETDEVNGGEAHLMRNMRDPATAQALLDRIARFKTRMSWHGVTPEANPSAGNKFRGLYNIALKSLGAVQKKDPRTTVDHVTDYAEPLSAPGFYFMDSPGNDLEAIAGQVAAGCNLILFVTGNGSITNFPFVPTLKITTTTKRHRLLEREMDINAGRYLDGETFESLTENALALLIDAASGTRTKGEQAGHYQTSIWRDWRQTDSRRLPQLLSAPPPDGSPLQLAFKTRPAPTPPLRTEAVGLVMPTSLCSSQIARMAIEQMNAAGLAADAGFSRFVALPHSEGCGFGGDEMERSLHRAFQGYATHPQVASALLLEHGCEKIPNDAMRRHFEANGLPSEQFGWASVQLDGGIDRTLRRIESWFREHPANNAALASDSARASTLPVGLSIGLMALEPPPAALIETLGQLAREVLENGGSLVIPETDPLLADAAFTAPLIGRTSVQATLANAEQISRPGFHVVRTETDHWGENTASLGACGLHLIVGWTASGLQTGHPLVPVLQITGPTGETRGDCCVGEPTPADRDAELRALIARTLTGEHTPVAHAAGMIDFQFTRGWLGVSA